jgi:hypothetical protein
MLFFQFFMINLVLTKSLGLKCHAVLLTVPMFAGFCVCHTDLGGGGGEVVIAAFLPPPASLASHHDFSSQCPSLTAVGRSAHRFVGFLAHRP